jgi:hypothetical protein
MSQAEDQSATETFEVIVPHTMRTVLSPVFL